MQDHVKWLAAQFRLAYEGDNWHDSSFREAVSGVTAALAFRQPPGGRNSIAALVRHLTAWKIFLTKRLQGDEAWNQEQDDSFDLQPYLPAGEASWQRLLAEADAAQAALLKALEEAPPEIFQRPVSGRSYNFDYLIHGILYHETFHTGQLKLLKLQLQQLEQEGPVSRH